MTARHRILAPLALAVALAGAAHAGAADVPWRDARQMVLVTTADWNVDHGTLRTFTRDGDRWREVRTATPVTIGKNGAAWGLGLNVSQTAAGGPVKHEGDNRSPAGVFRIGDSFGYASHGRTDMPYLALSVNDWCVDVSGSPYYNRIVDARLVGEAAVQGSTEPMRRDLHANGDDRYEEGFVIEHNRAAVPGAGSCIFAHRWQASDVGTAGCTAMEASTMRRLLRWLEPQDKPVFVLLTQADYQRLRAAWQLPALERDE